MAHHQAAIVKAVKASSSVGLYENTTDYDDDATNFGELVVNHVNAYAGAYARAYFQRAEKAGSDYQLREQYQRATRTAATGLLSAIGGSSSSSSIAPARGRADGLGASRGEDAPAGDGVSTPVDGLGAPLAQDAPAGSTTSTPRRSPRGGSASLRR